MTATPVLFPVARAHDPRQQSRRDLRDTVHRGDHRVQVTVIEIGASIGNRLPVRSYRVIPHHR